MLSTQSNYNSKDIIPSTGRAISSFLTLKKRKSDCTQTILKRTGARINRSVICIRIA